MALRVLMTKKKLEQKKAELEEISQLKEGFAVREADLEKAIEEAETEEEKEVVEAEIEQFENDKAEADEKEATLSGEVEGLEQELASLEGEQEQPETVPNEERKDEKPTMKRTIFDTMDVNTRSTFIENENVKAWLGEVRTAIKEKRAISNVGLTIPEVVLPLLRENIFNDSKLANKTNHVRVGGVARQNVLSTIPEAIWEECCSNLNELTLGFNDWTLDCFKVGGAFAICNANLEDSDYDLASEIITALAQAIALALDKAILYGRNSTANSKMPLGIVTRLVQEEAPADYPATARPWVDLHTSNITATSAIGLELFKELIIASGKISSDYARGNITWVMNDATYKKLVAESLAVNATGAIVAGVNGSMPVVGGDVVVLNFVPNDVIIYGYFDLYLLGERAGNQFASSEHVRFLQDQTVFRGTARYDGAPVIAESFGAVALNGASVSATAVSFPQDTANTGA